MKNTIEELIPYCLGKGLNRELRTSQKPLSAYVGINFIIKPLSVRKFFQKDHPQQYEGQKFLPPQPELKR